MPPTPTWRENLSNVDIEIFNIAKTQVDREQVRRWLDHIGADGYEIPSQEMASDPALLIALAAKRCYMSFEPGINPNVTKVRKDMVDYIDNILASGHGSVLAHSSYSFALEGVSRVFTAEMNRHAAGWAISEGPSGLSGSIRIFHGGYPLHLELLPVTVRTWRDGRVGLRLCSIAPSARCKRTILK